MQKVYRLLDVTRRHTSILSWNQPLHAKRSRPRVGRTSCGIETESKSTSVPPSGTMSSLRPVRSWLAALRALLAEREPPSAIGPAALLGSFGCELDQVALATRTPP